VSLSGTTGKCGSRLSPIPDSSASRPGKPFEPISHVDTGICVCGTVALVFVPSARAIMRIASLIKASASALLRLVTVTVRVRTQRCVAAPIPSFSRIRGQPTVAASRGLISRGRRSIRLFGLAPMSLQLCQADTGSRAFLGTRRAASEDTSSAQYVL
jgi:hypothetical protein